MFVFFPAVSLYKLWWQQPMKTYLQSFATECWSSSPSSSNLVSLLLHLNSKICHKTEVCSALNYWVTSALHHLAAVLQHSAAIIICTETENDSLSRWCICTQRRKAQMPAFCVCVAPWLSWPVWNPLGCSRGWLAWRPLHQKTQNSWK